MEPVRKSQSKLAEALGLTVKMLAPFQNAGWLGKPASDEEIERLHRAKSQLEALYSEDLPITSAELASPDRQMAFAMLKNSGDAWFKLMSPTQVSGALKISPEAAVKLFETGYKNQGKTEVLPGFKNPSGFWRTTESEFAAFRVHWHKYQSSTKPPLSLPEVRNMWKHPKGHLITLQSIRLKIRSGEIAAKKLNGQWVVDPDEAEAAYRKWYANKVGGEYEEV